MSDLPITVLIVEDDATDARLIREALANTGGSPFHVEWVKQLAIALERLARGDVDVVLLDLTLPDGQGIAVFDQVFQAAPNALILVLSTAIDEEMARQAVQRGAQDYLAKAHVDAHWLPRALRYVIERRTARGKLQDSEARFRAMSDASPLGIFVSDGQSSCTYTNAAYHKISGLNFEQTLGSNWMTAIHPEDTVCRQGGDEFVILLAEIEQQQDAALIAEKLLVASALPYHIGGHELHVTLSIGISVYPDDSNNTDSVMQNADTAMYHAKSIGRNNYQFFKADMNTSAVRRLVIESSLRRALKQKEFLLYYQPQVDIASGAMISAEALIRWQDPDLGLIQPAQFISIAEECGLIVPIGRWVLREACRQVKAWLDSGLNAVPVAVNVSALEFRDKNFLAGLDEILKEAGLAPHYLELELTENIIMHDAKASAAVLEALKAMGVRLAIDDFGTGYSSLSYLQRFPINTLKIDQSFVRDIATNTDGANIVSAVIGMGKSLGHRVIAEGVETQEQVDFLQASQCAQGQGFKFSLPLVADASRAC